MRRLACAIAALVAAVAPAAPAAAHAERSASTPKEGAAVAAPPGVLRITFTEPPTGDATVQVLDGCGRDVVTDVEVQNFEITSTLADGQPGDWNVQTNVISGVDGHNTRDRWTFRVRGEPDCSATETLAPPEAGGGEEDDDGGGGSSAPLIALGAATLVLIAVGLVLRSR